MCVFVFVFEFVFVLGSDNERGRAENFLSEWLGEMKFYVGKEKNFAEI